MYWRRKDAEVKEQFTIHPQNVKAKANYQRKPAISICQNQSTVKRTRAANLNVSTLN